MESIFTYLERTRVAWSAIVTKCLPSIQLHESLNKGKERQNFFRWNLLGSIKNRVTNAWRNWFFQNKTSTRQDFSYFLKIIIFLGYNSSHCSYKYSNIKMIRSEEFSKLTAIRSMSYSQNKSAEQRLSCFWELDKRQ